MIYIFHIKRVKLWFQYYNTKIFAKCSMQVCPMCVVKIMYEHRRNIIDDYKDATWALWSSELPATPQFVQPFVQAYIIEKIKAPCYWPLVRGIHRWLVASHHKGSVRIRYRPGVEWPKWNGKLTTYICNPQLQSHCFKSGCFNLYQMQCIHSLWFESHLSTK